MIRESGINGLYADSHPATPPTTIGSSPNSCTSTAQEKTPHPKISHLILITFSESPSNRLGSPFTTGEQTDDGSNDQIQEAKGHDNELGYCAPFGDHRPQLIT